MNSPKGTRPSNIIFISTDQLGAKFIGAYGSRVPSTPNLDALAHEGIRFDRYYASHPLCAPNRATMLTGRSMECHGIIDNNYQLTKANPTYAHILGAHGYKTGGFGKFHQTPMQWAPPPDLTCLGFDESIICEDPKWGTYLDWVRTNHPKEYPAALALVNAHSGSQSPDWETEKQQGAARDQFESRTQAYGRLLRPRIDGSVWERMYTSPISPEAHDSAFITQVSLDFIRRMGSSDKPFICHISYVEPHDPYDPPEPYAQLFKPEDMADPLPAEWRMQGPHILGRQQRNYLNFARIADNAGAIRELRARYHGQLRHLDDQLGRIVGELKRSGLWDNSILIFTSDHGEHLGDHGMIAKGLPQYDSGIRCPLIVAGGPMQGPQVSDRLCCTLDIVPTILEWADIPIDAWPPLEGKPLDDKDDVWNAVSVSLQEVNTVITTGGKRLTWYPDTGEGQLFDLIEDPDETRNLYADPGFQKEKLDLFQILLEAGTASRRIPRYANLAESDGWKYDFSAKSGEKAARRYMKYV